MSDSMRDLTIIFEEHCKGDIRLKIDFLMTVLNDGILLYIHIMLALENSSIKFVIIMVIL